MTISHNCELQIAKNEKSNFRVKPSKKTEMWGSKVGNYRSLNMCDLILESTLSKSVDFVLHKYNEL